MSGKGRQITHKNHYVPRFYLKLWSTNGHSVQIYDCIVSREHVKTWATGAISRTACWDDLYTNRVYGEDDDKFERLMERAFETPAKPVFDKVKCGAAINDEDMAILVNYLIAQLVRTPAWFLNIQKVYEEIAEPVIAEVIKDTLIDYDNGTLTSSNSDRMPRLYEPFGTSLKSDIDVRGNEVTVTVETYYGRRQFLNNAWRCITGRVGDHLRSQNWRLFDVPQGYELFASDNPVAIIGFRGNEMSIGANLGVGVDKVVVAMPVTPRHLLATQVGLSRVEMDALRLGDQLFSQFQRASIENATRYVYAPKPSRLVEKVRPRTIDSEYYEFISGARKLWGKEQDTVEDYFDNSSKEG